LPKYAKVTAGAANTRRLFAHQECDMDAVLDEALWRKIPGFEGWYECHPEGFVRSVERTRLSKHSERNGSYYRTFKSKILKHAPSSNYPSVSLWKDMVCVQKLVGHLVMLTFVGERPEGMEVCHKDGVPRNSRLDNLYYGTPKQNASDKIRHGTHLNGERLGWSVLTEADVLWIRANAGKIYQKDMAAKFGIRQSAISRVINRKHWRHI